jgi:hypothetical protein
VGHQIYFLKECKIKSVLSVHAQMVFKYFACLFEEKKNVLAFLKTSTNSEDCCESRTVRTNIRVTGGYRKQRTRLIKRVTGFSHLVSGLIEASRNFILDILHKKTPKYWENHQRSSKSTVLGPSKSYSSRDSISSREWLIVG